MLGDKRIAVTPAAKAKIAGARKLLKIADDDLKRLGEIGLSYDRISLVYDSVWETVEILTKLRSVVLGIERFDHECAAPTPAAAKTVKALPHIPIVPPVAKVARCKALPAPRAAERPRTIVTSPLQSNVLALPAPEMQSTLF